MLNKSSTEPEYLVETPSERIIRSLVQSRDMDSNCMVQVAAELRLLSKELDLQFVISGKILDSLHVLVQSVEGR